MRMRRDAWKRCPGDRQKGGGYMHVIWERCKDEDTCMSYESDARETGRKQDYEAQVSVCMCVCVHIYVTYKIMRTRSDAWETGDRQEARLWSAENKTMKLEHERTVNRAQATLFFWRSWGLHQTLFFWRFKTLFFWRSWSRATRALLLLQCLERELHHGARETWEY